MTKGYPSLSLDVFHRRSGDARTFHSLTREEIFYSLSFPLSGRVVEHTYFFYRHFSRSFALLFSSPRSENGSSFYLSLSSFPHNKCVVLRGRKNQHILLLSLREPVFLHHRRGGTLLVLSFCVSENSPSFPFLTVFTTKSLLCPLPLR